MNAVLDFRKKQITPAELELITLTSGTHPDRSNGLCAVEAAAWLAGQKHTDHPPCMCPVIGAFMRSWNDALQTDGDRNRLLKPLLSAILDTKTDKATETKRAFLCMDWLVREFTPMWLEGCDPDRYAKHVAALRALPEMTDWNFLINATSILVDARKETAATWDAALAAALAAAWDTARAAAWDAALAATWDATWDVARAAAWDAALAAARAATWDAALAAARAATWDAAWDAALAAVWDAALAAALAAAWDAARAAVRDTVWDTAKAAAKAAARAAARAAAWEKLAPVTENLQASTADLVCRMCAVV